MVIMAGYLSPRELAAGSCLLNLDLMVFITNQGFIRTMRYKVGTYLGARQVKEAKRLFKIVLMIDIPYAFLIVSLILFF
jgi:Na+-driven multidrug efflux pump